MPEDLFVRINILDVIEVIKPGYNFKADQFSNGIIHILIKYNYPKVPAFILNMEAG
ncbi:MAG: hypothetical protein K5745_00220 [Saccharofermentans sp.]|nr:hypothetical protein [Saccharofermentans sp.]